MVKRFFVVMFLTLIAFFPTVATASDQETPMALNELSIDMAFPMLYLAAGSVYAIPIFLTYQRVLATHLVLSVAPSFLYVRDNWSEESYVVLLWVGLAWHPFQEGLQGLFIGPAIAGAYSSNLFTAKRAGGSLMAGASLGYQILFSGNIDFDIEGGAAAGFAPDGSLTAWPRMVLALGYRF